jgi:hypothetical protein
MGDYGFKDRYVLENPYEVMLFLQSLAAVLRKDAYQ